MGCQAWMCDTCAFPFPGDMYLCPVCASAGGERMSSRRRKTAAWAIALAIWSTLGLAILMSGALASLMQTKGDQEIIGTIVGFLVLIPTLVGSGLGVSCLDRRLGNPALVWVAAVWNGVLLAAMVLLMVIGTAKG
jgi:hypothetical protein